MAFQASGDINCQLPVGEGLVPGQLAGRSQGPEVRGGTVSRNVVRTDREESGINRQAQRELGHSGSSRPLRSGLPRSARPSGSCPPSLPNRFCAAQPDGGPTSVGNRRKGLRLRPIGQQNGNGRSPFAARPVTAGLLFGLATKTNRGVGDASPGWVRMGRPRDGGRLSMAAQPTGCDANARPVRHRRSVGGAPRQPRARRDLCPGCGRPPGFGDRAGRRECPTVRGRLFRRQRDLRTAWVGVVPGWVGGQPAVWSDSSEAREAARSSHRRRTPGATAIPATPIPGFHSGRRVPPGPGRGGASFAMSRSVSSACSRSWLTELSPPVARAYLPQANTRSRRSRSSVNRVMPAQVASWPAASE